MEKVKINEKITTDKMSICEITPKLDELEFLIKTSLSLELYDEAYEYFNKLLILENFILNEDQRNIFMDTYKSKFNIIRNGWKNLLDFEQSESENTLIPSEIIEKEMQKLEIKIKSFSLNSLEIIEKLEKNSNNEITAVIIYEKLKADYLRYYAEVCDENEFIEYVNRSEKHYKNCYENCLNYLEPMNFLTLSVGLNYSIFVYFLLDDTQRAFNIAEKIYKEAVININIDTKIPETDALIKSIEENMTIWKLELEDN